MVEDEKSLSDKMNRWVQPIDKETKDIKEAVKELKEEIYILNKTGVYLSNKRLSDIIDKKFGPRLI